MLYFILLACFLIFSCDLQDEANQDCFGTQDGLAEIDDCGVCSGGDTGIEPNSTKDLCDKCFGSNECFDPHCNDESAINNYEGAIVVDNSLCIYDLCTDYFDSNDDFICNHGGDSPYLIGEQLSCETLETEFDICYPEDCGSVRLADFEDKIILIIYEWDW